MLVLLSVLVRGQLRSVFAVLLLSVGVLFVVRRARSGDKLRFEPRSLPEKEKVGSILANRQIKSIDLCCH